MVNVTGTGDPRPLTLRGLLILFVREFRVIFLLITAMTSLGLVIERTYEIKKLKILVYPASSFDRRLLDIVASPGCFRGWDTKVALVSFLPSIESEDLRLTILKLIESNKVRSISDDRFIIELGLTTRHERDLFQPEVIRFLDFYKSTIFEKANQCVGLLGANVPPSEQHIPLFALPSQKIVRQFLIRDYLDQAGFRYANDKHLEKLLREWIRSETGRLIFLADMQKTPPPIPLWLFLGCIGFLFAVLFLFMRSLFRGNFVVVH